MGETIRVLLVEDSEADAYLVTRALEDGGFRVDAVRVASLAAVREAMSEPWDLVISDYKLPGCNGDEILSMIRAARLDVPFVMISGVARDQETAVDSMHAGAGDFVLKDSLWRLPPVVRRELRAREELEIRQTVADMMPTGVIVARRESGAPDSFRVRWVNRTARSMLGRDDDLTGETLRDLLGRGDRDALVNACVEALAGQRVVGLEPRPDRDRMIEIEATPLGADRVGVFFNDVTEREQLWARQKMEVAGRLASGVAHDFNNALALIRGYAKFLEPHVAEDEEARDDVAVIRNAADRAKRLTDELIAFSQTRAPLPEDLALDGLIRETLERLGEQAGEAIAIELDLGADLALVSADRLMLERMLLNLARSARGVMDEGGILTFETRNAVVGDRDDELIRDGVAPGSYVRLAVIDNGEPLDPETRSRIFEPFGRPKAGLELATVYGIVSQSDGHIRALVAGARGARVEIYLPRIA